MRERPARPPLTCDPFVTDGDQFIARSIDHRAVILRSVGDRHRTMSVALNKRRDHSDLIAKVNSCIHPVVGSHLNGGEVAPRDTILSCVIFQAIVVDVWDVVKEELL